MPYGFKNRTVALMTGVKQKALVQGGAREIESEKLHPLSKAETITRRVQVIREGLRKENMLEGLLPNGAKALSSPGPDKNSPANLSHLLKVSKDTKATIDLERYSFTLCGLASTLTDAAQRGVKACVVADFCMRNYMRSHLKELLLAGIPVFVFELHAS